MYSLTMQKEVIIADSNSITNHHQNKGGACTYEIFTIVYPPATKLRQS